ncbi:hypothetical protein ACXD0S_003528 [Proteus mirabilis]
MKYLDLDPFAYGDNPEEANKLMELDLPDDIDLHYLVNGNVLSKEDEDKIIEKVFKYRGGVYVWKSNAKINK